MLANKAAGAMFKYTFSFDDMLLDLHEAGHITLDQVEKTCMSKEIKTDKFWKEQFAEIA